MKTTNDAVLRDHVSRWQTTGSLLRNLRDQEIRNADTASAMKSFTGLSELASKQRPPAPTSGLIEQQRWFMKLHTGA